MNESVVLGLAKESLTTALMIAAPILGASLVIGVIVSIIQAATQVNEMTLTFVPKLVGGFVVMLLFGPWMMETLVSFSAGLFANMASYGAEEYVVNELSPAWSYSFLLILIRTSGMLVSAPLLSHKGIPSWTKVGFAVFFAIVLVPLQKDNLPAPPQQLGDVAAGVIREVLFGLALGLGMNLVFIGIQMGSQIVGLQMGFGLGGILDPVSGVQNGVLDQFYALLVTLVFFSINGHYMVIQTLAETVRAIPPGSFDPFAIHSTAGMAGLMAGLTVSALRVAMPVMVALFLADLGLGFVARTVPQMNILMVGMPLKVIVGVVVLGASLPVTMQIMNGVIGSSLAGSSQLLLGGALMAGERTEAPTPKRIKDARQQGNVSKSHELVSIGVLLIAVAGARTIAPMMWSDLRDLLAQGLMYQQRGDMTQSAAMQMAQDTGGRTLSLMAPMLGLLALAGIVMNVAQTGFLLSGATLKPKMSRINPGSGLKRIFSPEGLVNLFKAIAKMAMVAVVVWMTLSGQIGEISAMGTLSPGEATGKLALLAFDIALRSALILFVLAVADFAWQRRRYLQQLRMSKQEFKQEMRESEGDPQVKQAQRRQRQSLMNRMISAVPGATVVVTNPTHYAVALKYDPLKMQAPIVVAKGERLLAQRIKEVARNAGVPVLEEPPLARALFAAVPVGHPIPANLFHAVAEVLAWVYSLRSRTTLSRPAAAGARGGI